MATAEGPARAHDRHGRRRPFSTWMKRLANLKNSSVTSHTGTSSKRGSTTTTSKGKKNANVKNNPYPLSGTVAAGGTTSRNDGISFAESSERHGRASRSQSQPSFAESNYDGQIPATSAKSTAPTLSTNGDTTVSDAAYSKAGTTATAGGGIGSAGGGEGSTFSSPAPSVRSLTTTLTTVQSTAPSTHIYGAQNGSHHTGGLPHVSSTQSSASQPMGVQFSHQFPSSPATAVPPHLAPNGNPTTYSTATANNLLTDNASILTLASSSKRRRRNSLDTNASVRALAPSSVFGGSRESLPLSVLSGNVAETSNASTLNTSGVITRPSLGGIASAERASVYSTGAGPLGSSGGERGSYYANKQSSGTGDGGSIRSGVHSHARNDSTGGSIAGGIASPVVNPPGGPGRVSRRSSGWVEVTGEASENDRDEEGRDGERDEAREDK